MMTRPQWMNSAACRTNPHFTESPISDQLATCVGCGVRGQCLDFGCTQIPAEPKDTLIYGGKLPVQVVREARRRGATPQPSFDEQIDALLAAIA